MKHRNTRLRALLAALVLCLGLLAGCGSASRPDDAAEEPFQSAAAPEGSAPESDESDHQADADDAPAEDSSADGTPISALPEDFPMELTFSSGAGAWRTVLTLQPDGSFTGQYSDWDGGGDPSQYPEGIYYICSFSGTFSDLRQLRPGGRHGVFPLHPGILHRCADHRSPPGGVAGVEPAGNRTGWAAGLLAAVQPGNGPGVLLL